MHRSQYIFYLFFCFIYFSNNIANEIPLDFVIIISSQSNEFFLQKAIELREEILLQKDQNTNFIVQFLHEDYSDVSGAWTILPIFKKISQNLNHTSFILFCGDETFVNISLLYSNLKNFDFSQDIFIGAELFDTQPVIIHHYAFFENSSLFKYPDLTSGFILSTKLITKMAGVYDKNKIDFSIDPIHELSKFLWHNGIFLTIVDFLCNFDSNNNLNNCATRSFSNFPMCKNKNISLDAILFVVKTCSKYHDSRLKVVKETWGKYPTRIYYFSDVEDAHLNTIDLKVPNTERGHCVKLMEILKFSYDEMLKNNFDWLFVADDDTLLSVSLLKEFLSCFNPINHLFIGERYGYKTIETWGYDYITLGGGMAISKGGLAMLLTHDDSNECRCAHLDAPDDMTIGACLRRRNIQPVHSPHFHQARPDDYSPSYLANHLPISFHRHWNMDPYDAYAIWFDKYDRLLSSQVVQRQDDEDLKIEL